MKLRLTLALLAALGAGTALAQDTASDKGKLSYAIGYNIGKARDVLKPDGPDHELRLRFFTPRTEASFVGHATVATHFVL